MKKIRLRKVDQPDLIPGQITLVAAKTIQGRAYDSFPVVLEVFDEEAGTVTPIEVVEDELVIIETEDVRTVPPEVQVPVYRPTGGPKGDSSGEGNSYPPGHRVISKEAIDEASRQLESLQPMDDEPS